MISFSNFFALQEEIKGWKNAGRDINKMRHDAAEAKKGTVVQSLKKDGNPNKMHNSTKRFNSRKEAEDWVKYVRSLNPGKTMRYSIDGEEI